MQNTSVKKKKIEVEILGGKYVIISAESEARVLKIATFVDELITNIKRSNPRMTSYCASVLAALNLCEELYKIKDEVSSLRNDKEELEILNEYKERLVRALQEAEANESKRISMQMKAEKLEGENEDLKDLLEEYKEKFTGMKLEIDDNRREINSLQSKLLDAQMELVKTRKRLLDKAKD